MRLLQPSLPKLPVGRANQALHIPSIDLDNTQSIDHVQMPGSEDFATSRMPSPNKVFDDETILEEMYPQLMRCNHIIMDSDDDWNPAQELSGTPDKSLEAPINSVLHRIFVTEDYSIAHHWFDSIVSWSNIDVTIDAFAHPPNPTHLDDYWNATNDEPFDFSWTLQTLWLNPPFSRLQQVVEKIYRDQAHGIIIIPIWPHHSWFHALFPIALKWFDFPTDANIFQSSTGRLVPQRRHWRVRAVVFNAFDCPRQHTGYRSWYIKSDLHFPVRGVISIANQHPKSQPYVQSLQDDFPDVFGQPKLARDIDPSVRGDYHYCTIGLKPDPFQNLLNPTESKVN